MNDLSEEILKKLTDLQPFFRERCGKPRNDDEYYLEDRNAIVKIGLYKAQPLDLLLPKVAPGLGEKGEGRTLWEMVSGEKYLVQKGDVVALCDDRLREFRATTLAEALLSAIWQQQIGGKS